MWNIHLVNRLLGFTSQIADYSSNSPSTTTVKNLKNRQITAGHLLSPKFRVKPPHLAVADSKLPFQPGFRPPLAANGATASWALASKGVQTSGAAATQARLVCCRATCRSAARSPHQDRVRVGWSNWNTSM